MKKVTLLLFILSMTAMSYAQKSPRKQTSGEVNSAKIEVDWGAPSVRGRVIWGGLEAYDKVWRAGANQNTVVALSKAVKLDGKELGAGKYGLFIIPKKEGDWVVIFSTKSDAWGAYSYKQSEDALRLNVTPKFVEKNQEVLDFKVTDNALVFAWEKVQLSIPIE